nr:cyclic-di-AMP receptor [Bacillus suaedae]
MYSLLIYGLVQFSITPPLSNINRNIIILTRINLDKSLKLEGKPVKLLICIIDNVFADGVEKQLKQQGYRMTELASSGGFWRKGNTTFLFGVEEVDVPDLKRALHSACLNIEKNKQLKTKQAHRYTSFLIDVKDAVPILGFNNDLN